MLNEPNQACIIKQKPIQVYLDLIQTELGILEGKLNCLYQDLRPVMKESPKATLKEEESPDQSALSHTLLIYINTLRNANKYIDTIQEQLEI